MALPGAVALHSDRSSGQSRVKGGWLAQLSTDYADVCVEWERLAESGAALPFQRRGWLQHWYEAHRQPDFLAVLVTVRHRCTGAAVMALPLVLYRDGPLRVISFADGGLTDYNAPILGADAPPDAASACQILCAIRAILPPADLLYFGKMPLHVGGRTNGLALLPGTHASSLTGNILHVPRGWDDWHHGLERTFRKELERSLRVFQKAPGAEFRHITGAAEIARVYGVLKSQQRERIAELGLPYILDDPACERFYDGLVAGGETILTALMAGEEVVAALLGIENGGHYAMVRLSTAGAKWKTCSPGRLLIERTMRMLHNQGCRKFDFTIGEYAYKRRMGVTNVPLHEWRLALSWRGWPLVIKKNARAFVRLSPGIKRLAKAIQAKLMSHPG